MAATVQLNTRIDPDLKRRGDAVFSRAGLTSSQVVRAVWEAAATTQEVPECILAHRERDDIDARLAAIHDGYGLAIRVMEDLGVHFKDPGEREPVDCRAERDAMYAEMADRFEAEYGQI